MNNEYADKLGAYGINPANYDELEQEEITATLTEYEEYKAYADIYRKELEAGEPIRQRLPRVLAGNGRPRNHQPVRKLRHRDQHQNRGLGTRLPLREAELAYSDEHAFHKKRRHSPHKVRVA